MSEAGEARVRAALAAGDAPAPGDVAEVIAELDRVRAESAARWDAIGRLAPAAKAQRDRAQDAERVIAEVADALAAPLDDAARAALRARLRRS